jgi:4-amino-4-deoxy-L-arabinose transferase-like glycosyltransferase
MPNRVRPLEPQSSHLPPRKIHPLWWILIAGVLVRVGLSYVWTDWSPLLNSDARDYQQLATQLASRGEYANERGRLVSLRPPLYPAMVAATYRGFGIQNNHVIRAAQAVIGLLSAVLVYRLGVLAYSRPVGLWTAGIVCFYPSLLGYANLLLTETLFTFFVVALTCVVCEAIQRQQVAFLVIAGIVMGLGALTRSIMLLFAPLLSAAVFVSWRGSWPRRLTAAIVPLAVFAAVIAPWAIRNTRLQRTLTMIDVMGGRNAMMGNYEHTPLERSWATISDVSPEHQWHRVLRREREPDAPTLTQGQLDKLALRHAIAFITEHPWLTLKRDAVKFFNFWQLEREFIAAARDGYFGDVGGGVQLVIAALICGGYAAVLMLALFGACCAPPSDWRLHWFLVLSILFPCAVHTLIFAHSRYHLPVIPLLAVYAAAAVVYRKAIWQMVRNWRFKLAATLCGVVVLAWIRELVFADLNLLKHFAS